MKRKWIWLCLAFHVFACANSIFPQDLWVLESFEEGTKQWFVQTKQSENEELPLVHLTTTSLTPPEGGKQAGLFVWRRANRGDWGRFVFPLDGAQLSAKRAKGLTFWWVGDGGQATVSFILVAERQGIERSFKVELTTPPTWQQVHLGWEAFRDEDETPATVFVRYLKELRIERVGPFAPFFFIMDELATEVAAPPCRQLALAPLWTFNKNGRRICLGGEHIGTRKRFCSFKTQQPVNALPI